MGKRNTDKRIPAAPTRLIPAVLPVIPADPLLSFPQALSVIPAVSLLSFPQVSPITNVGDKFSGNPVKNNLYPEVDQGDTSPQQGEYNFRIPCRLGTGPPRHEKEEKAHGFPINNVGNDRKGF